MDSVLFNEDLFRNIIGHLTDPRIKKFSSNIPVPLNPDRRLSTLLTLALTCRAFSDPALDEIWWRLDTVEHLLKILPTFIQASRDICGWEPGTLDFPILLKDWERMPNYAKRIRYFVHVEAHRIEKAVWQRLDQRKRQPLLPRLRYLYSTCEEGPELFCFVSPTLTLTHIHLHPTIYKYLPQRPEHHHTRHLTQYRLPAVYPEPEGHEVARILPYTNNADSRHRILRGPNMENLDLPGSYRYLEQNEAEHHKELTQENINVMSPDDLAAARKGILFILDLCRHMPHLSVVKLEGWHWVIHTVCKPE